MEATPAFNTSRESPSHPSIGRHSRASSVSQFSGILSSGSGRGGNLKSLNAKGWPECNVIQEEGSYEGLAGDSGLSLLCKIVLWLLILCMVFTGICLSMWAAERTYMPDVMVKFYASEGTDHSGISAKRVTVSCSLNMVVYNPGPMFGIHVTLGPVILLYSDTTIGVGQVHKYYQPSNSRHGVSAVIHGRKAPLYGAGGGLDLSSDDGSVPLTLDFELISRGYIISQLVRVTHKAHVTCNITVGAKETRPIRFPKDACAVYKA